MKLGRKHRKSLRNDQRRFGNNNRGGKREMIAFGSSSALTGESFLNETVWEAS